jgi:hypothetical protein
MLLATFEDLDESEVTREVSDDLMERGGWERE